MPLLIVLAGGMLFYAADVMAAAYEACALFVHSVLPGLYPFMTVMLLITSRLKPGRMTLPVVLMGLFSGSPSGARLLRYGSFTKKTYRAAVHATAVMSPMFILGTAASWLNGYGLAMFLSSMFSALLTAGLSLLFPMKDGQSMIQGEDARDQALTLWEAMNRAAQTMLTVCGCMVMANCLSILLFKIIPDVDPIGKAITAGLMEVTKGTSDISRIVFSDDTVAPSLCVMLISMGGVSLFMQNYAFYIKGAFSTGSYLLFKLLQGGTAYGLCRLLVTLFAPAARQTAALIIPSAGDVPAFVWIGSFVISEIMLQWFERSKRRAKDASLKQHQSRARG